MIKTFKYRKYSVMVAAVNKDEDKILITCTATMMKDATCKGSIDLLVEEFGNMWHRKVGENTVLFFIKNKAWKAVLADMAGGFERIEDLD